jgi:uncharacterized LabA/DUF88 family protein
MSKRTIVYIDGFNLYHAIDDLREPHLKWVDLWALSEKLLRGDQQLVAVKYFTAYATWRPASYRRHERYVAALEEHGVTPVIGRFKRKTVKCHARCRQTYITHEEKETDVNIGVHLIADALRDRFDRALVVSADTDLNSAVALAGHEAPTKRIDLVAPPNRLGRNSAALFEVTKGRVRSSLLPAQITRADGKVITRPAEYAPPQQDRA